MGRNKALIAISLYEYSYVKLAHKSDARTFQCALLHEIFALYVTKKESQHVLDIADHSSMENGVSLETRTNGLARQESPFSSVVSVFVRFAESHGFESHLGLSQVYSLSHVR